MGETHRILLTGENADLAKLQRQWATPGFSPDDGLAPLDSLHQAGDAIVAVVQMTEQGLIAQGSGVMVGPGIVLTATHVLDDFPDDGTGPVCMTFLESGARAWLPYVKVNASGHSPFDVLGRGRRMRSDLAVLSCSLWSDAYIKSPLTLAPVELCLPMPGERLWAVGFRHGEIKDSAAAITPFVSSGIVRQCFPNGRGERMPSPCLEVDMDTLGGMSGGPVYNERDRLVGIVSSCVDGGGPTYVTLVWDAMRFQLDRLPACVWPGGEGSLWTGSQRGLVRLYGQFKHQNGDTTITLPDDAMKILLEHAAHGPHPPQDEKAGAD